MYNTSFVDFIELLPTGGRTKLKKDRLKKKIQGIALL